MLREMKIKEPAAEHGTASPRKREMDRSIVLRILPSSEYKHSTSRGSMFINEQAKDKLLVLQIANFSDKANPVRALPSGVYSEASRPFPNSPNRFSDAGSRSASAGTAEAE